MTDTDTLSETRPSGPSPADPLPAPRRGAMTIALLVAAALFMENLDTTILITALPDMARTFGVHAIDLSVGVSAYVLTLATFIPLSGWLTDRFGGRAVFAAAILIFTVSSALCGLSEGLWSFTLARIAQGIGGAMMVPVGRLLVLRAADKSELIRAIATLTWPALAAPVLGPPLGGVITTYLSWPWIFFLNVPLGIVAFVLTFRLMPSERVEGTRRFDAAGFVLTSVSCFALMLAVELLSREDTPWPLVAAAAAGGLAIGTWAVLHARTHRAPLVDLWALSVPSFAATMRGGSLVRVAIHSMPFLLSLLFQVGLGLDPLTSGLFILAVFAGNLAMKMVTTRLLHRFSFRSILFANGLVNAALIAACIAIGASTPVLVTLVLLFAGGLARSVQLTAITTLAFADIPPERMSSANALSNMAHQMSIGAGVAFAAACLRLGEMLFPTAGSGVSLSAFHVAFAIMAAISVLAAMDALLLHPKAGDAIREPHRGK